MRVMLDTNIFISVFVFKSKGLERILGYICEKHHLVISSYILSEIETVVSLKFPSKTTALDSFLTEIPFEIEYTPQELPTHDFFEIRDKNDEKVLYSAITSDVDILITGDKDFADIEIEKPLILTPSEFVLEYMK